jgi:ADP-L-glycero-D-manno-heptose 6-epimerase
MRSRYIVTGGLGFIGSNMVHFLNKNHNSTADVVVCDRVRSDRFKNISGARVVDLIKPEELLLYLRENCTLVDGIFHLGACSDTMNFDEQYVMSKNFEFTRALVDFCLVKKISLVYASSASVYGAQIEPSLEHAPETPLNLYAFSKSMVDQYVRQEIKRFSHLSKDHRPSIVGLRYFNVYGPREQHKGRMASFIFQKYQEMKNKGYIKLFKPGTQKRDFIYVEDVCKVNWAAMSSRGTMDIFNVGTGVAPTFEEVSRVIASELGYDASKLQFVDFPKELEGRYQDYTCSDNTKLKTIYDGEFTSYKDGIAKTIDAYEEYR